MQLSVLPARTALHGARVTCRQCRLLTRMFEQRAACALHDSGER